MTLTADHARAFSRLLRKLGASSPHFRDAGDPITVIVQSFLLWECPTDKAMAAYGRFTSNVVDFNELRVSLPHETIEILGPRYPRAEERCMRMRAVLNDVYRREHAVSLDRIRIMGKREIKRYIDTLDGIVPYVAARVALLCFEVHSIPVDERLRQQLVREDAAVEATDPVELAAWLARHVKSEAGADVHRRLGSWVDARERRLARSAQRVTVTKAPKKVAARKRGADAKKTQSPRARSATSGARAAAKAT